MNALNTKRLGFALGTAFSIVYLGNIFIIHTVPKEEAVYFFNSIVHGIDTVSIIRLNMPLSEMIVGVFEVFILGWLFGAAVAILYNFGSERGGDRNA
jgi:hypothetical protein